MSPYCIYVCTSIADQKICSALISIPSKHETFAKFDRMLGQRRRRWTSTAPALGEPHVFAGLSLISGTQLIQCLFGGCDAGTIIIGPMSSLAADALFTVQRGGTPLVGVGSFMLIGTKRTGKSKKKYSIDSLRVFVARKRQDASSRH